MTNRSYAEIIRIVPHSGVQFLVLDFDLESGPRFSRPFVEHKRLDEVDADGSFPVELRPGWNDDDPDADPPFAAKATDSVYDISKQKALEPFLSRWVPVPFLAVQARRDSLGRD
jgi:hypothetical protein